MNRLVGDGPKVSSDPILTVSVENTGWSAGELLTPSSMQELRDRGMKSDKNQAATAATLE